MYYGDMILNTYELYHELAVYMPKTFTRKVMIFLNENRMLEPDYQCQSGQYIATIELVDILDGLDCFEWIIEKALEKRFGKAV